MGRHCVVVQMLLMVMSWLTPSAPTTCTTIRRQCCQAWPAAPSQQHTTDCIVHAMCLSMCLSNTSGWPVWPLLAIPSLAVLPSCASAPAAAADAAAASEGGPTQPSATATATATGAWGRAPDVSEVAEVRSGMIPCSAAWPACSDATFADPGRLSAAAPPPPQGVGSAPVGACQARGSAAQPLAAAAAAVAAAGGGRGCNGGDGSAAELERCTASGSGHQRAYLPTPCAPPREALTMTVCLPPSALRPTWLTMASTRSR